MSEVRAAATRQFLARKFILRLLQSVAEADTGVEALN
jgi:hypothetical protein